MDTSALVTSGMFQTITTEGRSTLILKQPVRIVVPNSILDRLAAIYPKNSEMGGFLYAEADTKTNTLTVREIVRLTNYSTSDVTFQPRTVDYNRAITAALAADLLPLRFHSHPISTVNNLYNLQSLNFFQKTSQTDRHNSYLPVYVGAQAIVLPDCLISPNDRDGQSVRFSIYNGFIAPTSYRALLPNEQVFIYFVGLALVVVWTLYGWKKAISALVVCALIGLIVFVSEKRPTYTNEQNQLVITQ